MASKKISQLPAAGALTGTELVPVVQVGATVRAALNDLPASAAVDARLDAVENGRVQSIEELRGIAVDDTAAFNAMITAVTAAGTVAGMMTLKAGVTYTVDPLTLATPISVYGPQATLKLKNAATETANRKNVLTITSSDVHVHCDVDANRAGQSLVAYNAGGGIANKFWYGVNVKGAAGALLERVTVTGRIRNAMDWGFRADFTGDGCNFNVRVETSGAGAAAYDGSGFTFRARLRSLDNAGAFMYPHAFDLFRCENFDADVRSTDQAGSGTATAGTSASNWVSGITVLNCRRGYVKGYFEARDDGAMTKSVGSSFLENHRVDFDVHAIGYSEVSMETGANLHCKFSGLADGRYQTNNEGTACRGISSYGAGFYPGFASRSQRVNEHCEFDVEVRRHIGDGITVNGGRDLKFRGRSHSNRRGLVTLAIATNTEDHFYNSPAQNIVGLDTSGLDCSFNELSGYDVRDQRRMRGTNCRANNNGQANNFPATKAVTGLASTNVLTSPAHGMREGAGFSFGSITGGAPLVISTVYYARDVTANTFKVALTSGGAAVDITTDLTAGMIGGGAREDGATDTGAAGLNSGNAGNLGQSTTIKYLAPEACDDQTGTDFCSISPTTPGTLSVQTPASYNVGQVIKLTGCGPAGADLYTRITDIDKDEITVSPAPSTFPTVSPAGTITTTATALVTSSAVLASYRARYWITSGGNSRQMIQTDTSTTGVLASAFPSNLAAAAWTISQATVTFLPSQNYGVAGTNIVVIGETISGNKTAAITGGSANSRPRSYASGGTPSGATLPDGARISTRTPTAADYTANVNDQLVAVTNTAAARTITLPTLASVPDNWPLAIKDESGLAGTNNIIVDGNGAEQIEGTATKTIAANFGSLRVYKPTGGTQWMVAP